MVKFIPINRLYNDIGEEYLDLVSTLYKTADTHFEDHYTTECETLLKKICGRKHALLTTSGTASINIMLLAADINPGDNVITTSYSCPATVMPIKLMGANPIFYDINRYGCQDVSNITHTAKAILVTGLYGDSCDFEKIDHPMVLNDSAQCMGGLYKNKSSVSYGDMSILSFATNKNCPVFGTYGAVLTDNDALADKIWLMRRNGYRNRDVGNSIQHIGINAQPHEDKALQLYCSLQHLEKWQMRRKQIADFYKDELKKLDITVRPSPSYSETNNHKFCIFVDNKTMLRDKMLDNGVECQLHYTYNFSQVPLLSNQLDSDFKFTEQFKQHAISLPSSPWLTDTEAETVVQTLKKCITDADKGVKING
tara:strand:+ start:201 stop:1301 length:1101 start_codon:yes stop_codon:yes gene_type:complete